MKYLKHKGLEITQSVSKSIKLTTTSINRNAAFCQLLEYMIEQKIPEAARIEQFIPIIKDRAKISVIDYLVFNQPLTQPISTYTDSEGDKYYGEVN